MLLEDGVVLGEEVVVEVDFEDVMMCVVEVTVEEVEGVVVVIDSSSLTHIWRTGLLSMSFVSDAPNRATIPDDLAFKWSPSEPISSP